MKENKKDFNTFKKVYRWVLNDHLEYKEYNKNYVDNSMEIIPILAIIWMLVVGVILIIDGVN